MTEKELVWPKPGDSLFSSNPTFATYSFPMGKESWETYAIAYREAAEIVVKELSCSRTILSYTILPALFLFRHYVELRLKSLVLQCQKATREEPSVSGKHELGPAWGALKGYARRLNLGFDRKDAHAVESCILELAAMDPNHAIAFRYPVDMQGNETLRPTSVPIENLARTMEKIGNYLDATGDCIDAILDAQQQSAEAFDPGPDDSGE